MLRGEERTRERERIRKVCAGKGREGGIDRSLNLVVDVQSIVVEACKERERGKGEGGRGG